MKHCTPQRIARLLVVTVPLALVAGCPLPAFQYSPLDDLQGTYWIEYVKDEVVVYELPEFRGEDALWYALKTSTPEWYSSPGLYETSGGGVWTRVTTDETLTWDEILQLHDPAPDPNTVGGKSVAASLAGLYWAEYGDGELAVFKLPEQRGEEGRWSQVETGEPAWYAGPGLYEVSAGFQWVLVSSEEEFTLDDIMQLYDLRPRPPGDPATGAHVSG